MKFTGSSVPAKSMALENRNKTGETMVAYRNIRLDDIEDFWEYPKKMEKLSKQRKKNRLLPRKRAVSLVIKKTDRNRT